MSELTATRTLVRFMVRRDRVRIAVWILAIVALMLTTVSSVKGLYPTQASLDRAAAAIEGNAAVIRAQRSADRPAHARRTGGV